MNKLIHIFAFFVLLLALRRWPRRRSQGPGLRARMGRAGQGTGRRQGSASTSPRRALQDPHHIEARPSLIARARNADLLVCTGAELEVGWLPLLIRQSGNARIQPGKPGHFEAAAFVRMLEVPQRLDRARRRRARRRQPAHPDRSAQHRARGRAAGAPPGRARSGQRGDLPGAQRRFPGALERGASSAGTSEAAPLRGTPVVVQHKAFPYLQHWLGLRGGGRAGAQARRGADQRAPQPVLARPAGAAGQDDPARRLQRRRGRRSGWPSARKLPVVVLPFTVGGNDQAKDLFGAVRRHGAAAAERAPK